jgi:protein phosphatase
VTIEVAGLSDVGRVRQNNEDHFLITRFGRHMTVADSNLPAGVVIPWVEEQGVALVVADGIGGGAYGEEASKLAIAFLARLVLETPDWILRMDDESQPREVAKRTAERYEMVGRMMGEEAAANPHLLGFGTTLTAAFSIGRALFVGHVGDSRGYLYRDRQLIPLTRDHTVAQRLVDTHQIDQMQAATHRLRHLLTRSIGDKVAPVQPDVAQAVLNDDDRLLVCSDGLTNMVGEDVITQILGSELPPAAVCRALVDLANSAGGKDNITVAVAHYRFD